MMKLLVHSRRNYLVEIPGKLKADVLVYRQYENLKEFSGLQFSCLTEEMCYTCGSVRQHPI